jgi:hypothetical protein
MNMEEVVVNQEMHIPHLVHYKTTLYRVGHKKVAHLPFAFAFGYCINFCIYVWYRAGLLFCGPPCINFTFNCNWRLQYIVIYCIIFAEGVKKKCGVKHM